MCLCRRDRPGATGYRLHPPERVLPHLPGRDLWEAWLDGWREQDRDMRLTTAIEKHMRRKR